MKLFSILSMVLLLTACATPTTQTTNGMVKRDKDTEYAVIENNKGFHLTVRYSRYQFIPESDAVATACKAALTSLAWEISDQNARSILPINEQRIRISMGRNGFTGITSCEASGVVEWKNSTP